MTDTAALHDEAMAIADEGDRARRTGDHPEAREYFARAMALERRAADAETTQPSRSILYRSAAWLALEAEDAVEAERLAACGLSDREVPDRVKGELRAVAEEARLRLHRPLPPPTAVSSLTLHLEGPEVGYGGADTADVDPRVAAVKHLVVRTAERRQGRDFRARGAPAAALLRQLQPRVGYAAGSVVVQVTLGGSQPSLWDDNGLIVDDVRRGLAAFAQGGEEALTLLITDSTYRENFVNLASQLSPDGSRVTSVDVLAATARGPLPVVHLRRRPSVTRIGRRPSGEREIVGELRAADETQSKNTIKVQDDDGGVHRVRVRDAVMEDIVRPFYGARVRVVVRPRGGDLELVGLPQVAELEVSEPGVSQAVAPVERVRY